MNLTDAEQRLWSRLRRKQILGLQFYRQKPIGNYIVDFYAPTAQLVIELDGSQHFDLAQARRDKQRTEFLEQQDLMVLRFDDRQVLTQTESVVEEIFRFVSEKKIPPNLPFTKGGT
jgi:very-short-patch-repair endonuclease